MEIKKMLYAAKENTLVLLKPTDENYPEVLDFMVLTGLQVFTDDDYIFAVISKNDECADIVLKSLNKYFDTEIWKLEEYKNIFRFKDFNGNNDIYMNNLEKYFAQNFSEKVNDFSLESGRITAFKRGKWLSFVKEHKEDCVLYWLENNEEAEEDE